MLYWYERGQCGLCLGLNVVRASIASKYDLKTVIVSMRSSSIYSMWVCG